MCGRMNRRTGRNIPLLVLSLIVLSLAFTTPTSAQIKGLVCIASNGTVTVRAKKCLPSEAAASLSNFAKTGEKGPTGQEGKAGIRGRRIESFSDYQVLPLNAAAVVVASCNSDEMVVGGGCGCATACRAPISASGPVPVVDSATARQGWRCAFSSNQSGLIIAGTFTAYAICAESN